MAPVVHGLESKYFGKVDFTYLDIDDAANAEYKRQFNFRYQPQFFLVDGNGVIQKEWIGYVPDFELEAEFAKLIN
ncbi:MAG: hypothetical protein HQ525_05085 [Anaerolineae bacterium]|nr:hypothetical protein [Anaerolineae bacterium]